LASFVWVLGGGGGGVHGAEEWVGFGGQRGGGGNG